MYFLKALLKTSQKIFLAISYSALKITTSLHMQQYDYSLKMNVFRSVKLNLVDRFLYTCMPWFTCSSVEHGENFFGLTGAILQP